MRNEDQQPETGTTAIETVAESQTLQSRRGLLRIATLGTAAVRTRAIERKLRDVESLPDTSSAQLLEDDTGAAP